MKGELRMLEYLTYEEIDEEIAQCYAQIEQAEKRIKYLQDFRKKQEYIDSLLAELRKKG
jgi:hypothetical protein